MNKETKDFQKATPKKASSVTQDATPEVNYAYYSRVLNKPFDSIGELREAEAAYYAEIKAKEDKASQKKADAQKVEEAFKALNATRRAYKEGLIKLTEKYSEDLKALKEAFEGSKKEIQEILAEAEEAYSNSLKAFTEKYPEGYHLTLKDGDFETTISGASKINKETTANKPFDFVEWFFSL